MAEGLEADGPKPHVCPPALFGGVSSAATSLITSAAIELPTTTSRVSMWRTLDHCGATTLRAGTLSAGPASANPLRRPKCPYHSRMQLVYVRSPLLSPSPGSLLDVFRFCASATATEAEVPPRVCRQPQRFHGGFPRPALPDSHRWSSTVR